MQLLTNAANLRQLYVALTTPTQCDSLVPKSSIFFSLQPSLATSVMPGKNSIHQKGKEERKRSSNQNIRRGEQPSFRQAEKDTASRQKSFSKGAEDEGEVLSRVEKSDDFVWNLPGFDKHEFYAAAHFLRKQEKNQGFRTKFGNTAQTSLSIKHALATGQAEADMLDYLALLFARAKYEDTPAKHVTATALKLGVRGFEVWIAKNDGPKKEDESFRANLEEWFNKKDYSRWEKEPASMAVDLKYFWRDRHNYYASKIVSLWKEICRGPRSENEDGPTTVPERRKKLGSRDEAAGADKSFEVLYRIYENELADLDHLKADWNQVKALCTAEGIQQQLKVADDTILPLDIELQSYATVKLKEPNSHLQLVRTFCKLLKCIRLLSTVRKAIQAFETFRQDIVKNNRVRLQFVDPITPQDLDQEECKDIAARMDRWIKVSTDLDFEREVQNVANALREGQGFHRYFHCELQMLDKFLEDENVYDYFGCSKLSCFTCWGVLRGTPFRTRDTHANLWSACAFPFEMNSGGQTNSSRYQLLFALKKVQDHVTERVLRRAMDPEFNFSGAASLAETEPDGELKARRKIRLSSKHREDGSTTQVTSARAIRIPATGEPVCEVTEFFEADRGSSDQCSIAPFVWADWKLAGNTFFLNHLQIEEVSSERRGKDRISIYICAHRFNAEPANHWYATLIEAFHSHKYEPLDRKCRWRGDLYVFRTIMGQQPSPMPSDVDFLEAINSSSAHPKPNNLDSIEEEEKEEVIQRCRYALQQSWLNLPYAITLTATK
jgi:hypothetical protein